MSVKNIARNLFLSGALVLSGGVVCGRPVSANNLDKAHELLDHIDALEMCKCIAFFERCIFNVLNQGKNGGYGSSCLDAFELQKCFEQKIKCLDEKGLVEKRSLEQKTPQEFFYDTNGTKIY